MIRRLGVLLLASLVTTVAFAADPVASVTKNSGQVMVSHEGGSFQPVATNQPLVPGDRVMVGEGGSVVVTFNDGCQMSVKAGTIATVPANSTCAGADVATENAPNGAAGGAGRTSPNFDWATFGWVAVPTMLYVVVENEGETASP